MNMTAIILAAVFSVGSTFGFMSAKFVYDVEGLKTKIESTENKLSRCIKDKQTTDALLEDGRKLNEDLYGKNTTLRQRLEDFLNSADTQKEEPKNEAPKTTSSPDYCVTPSRMRDIERIREHAPGNSSARPTSRN